MTQRLDLSAFKELPAGVARPGYAPQDHGRGIVHIGCGAFFRAHQAVYTDAALARSGGDWRIAAISPRSVEIVDAMAPQDGLFTLVERGGEGASARVVASVAEVVAAAREPAVALDRLCDAATRIVTLTVTEKAYGIDRGAGDIDEKHPAVAADIADPRNPTGVLGMLVEALRRRFEAGLEPFTVLCCDNLPDNGALLRTGVVGLARRSDAALAERIDREVAFPSSMVDRITPAPTSSTYEDAERLTGFADEAAVETEPFIQWVIEDEFPQGRPDWEAGGALFVENVGPYEAMKLRMLNGAHSLIAYAGFLAGHRYVRDVMADRALASLVERHLTAAAATLPALPEIDLKAYARDLVQRFANPAIAHQTYQIAMDGSQKLPQRLVAPAVDTLGEGGSTRAFAFAIAAWMRYCLARTEAGEPYDLRDPMEGAIAKAVEAGKGDPRQLAERLLALGDIFPSRLTEAKAFRQELDECLSAMIEDGMRAAIDSETERARV